MPNGSEKTGSGGARVWVSIGQKVRLGKYETLDVDVGAADDVLEKETVREAIRRVAANVRAEHQDLLDVLKADKGL